MTMTTVQTVLNSVGIMGVAFAAWGFVLPSAGLSSMLNDKGAKVFEASPPKSKELALIFMRWLHMFFGVYSIAVLTVANAPPSKAISLLTLGLSGVFALDGLVCKTSFITSKIMNFKDAHLGLVFDFCMSALLFTHYRSDPIR